VALAEAAIGGPYATAAHGAGVDLREYEADRADREDTDAALLYGEDHGRVVISCDPAKEAAVRTLAAEFGVPLYAVGFVGAPNADLAITTSSATYHWPSAALRNTYLTAIPRRMAHAVEDGAKE
jgi:hypothetical protein